MNMHLIQQLKNLDRVLFTLINHDSDSKLLDPIMIAIRNPLTWIPLYVFLAGYIIVKFKRHAFLFIGLSVLTVVMTDTITFLLLKPMFHRLRPCCDPTLSVFVRSLVNCGGKYSFPSNHAANHTGLSCFWILSIKTITGRKLTWMLIWPAVIGYSQIYVGQHFPADILAGGIVGLIIALLTGWIFRILYIRAAIQ
jgi:membrane-associated phospholipid phosphatase